MKHYSCAVAIIAAALLVPGFSGCESKAAKMQREFAQALITNKQKVFDEIHPVGTAKSVQIHSISQSGNKINARFTLFWEGPITKDGYTKINAQYDTEIGRWVNGSIEDTNGITMNDLKKAAFDFGFGFGLGIGGGG